MKRMIVALTVLLALSRGATAASPEWKAAPGPAISGAADIDHATWSVAREPGGPFDRIEVHRYRAKGATPSSTLLYLPGTNMNGEVAVPDEDHNLWIFLARRGVEVYTLDYRTRFASSSTDPVALASMKAWTTEAFVDDIRAAAALARRESGRERLFVAGFSRGVFLAYAYACSEPAGVSGLIALDGLFKSHAPKDQYDPAADLAKLETSGAWATDVAGRLGWEGRQRLMMAVAENPGAPATDPKFKTLGGQSRPEVLGRLLAGYDRYYPAIQDIDGKRMADRDDDAKTAVDDLWGEMKAPVLYFGNARMPNDWLLNGIYSAQKSGSPDVQMHVLDGYGHLDVLVGDHARRDVFEPSLAWILKRATRP